MNNRQSSPAHAGFSLSGRGWVPLLLLLALWGTRLGALDALPLHNDEGLHLTRAVEVWNLHPFWEIRDGKIINHWLIAAFYPQNAPVFVGRFATLLVSMVGLAAGYALVRRVGGGLSASFAAILWITSPYLFLYERLALSDAEAGALVVVAVAAALRLAHTDRRRDAVLTGLALAGATLMKFTAVPFSLAILLVVAILGRGTKVRKLSHLVVIGLVVAACFAVPLGYLALRGQDFFGIALGWVSAGGGSGEDSGPASNLVRLGEQLLDFGPALWSALMVGGLAALPVLWRKTGAVLLTGLLVPLAIMILFGTQVLSRHYVVALPLALTLGGAGVGSLIARLPRSTRAVSAGVVTAALAVLFVPFALQAYRDPSMMPLPPGDRSQLITDHSGGYGLREAVLAFPKTISDPTLPVIGSMFPDSCRRGNFYASDIRMVCTDAPARDAIEAALAEDGAVYVVVDSAGSIGIDVTTVDADATQIATYPRPDDPADAPDIVVWRLDRH